MWIKYLGTVHISLTLSLSGPAKHDTAPGDLRGRSESRHGHASAERSAHQPGFRQHPGTLWYKMSSLLVFLKECRDWRYRQLYWYFLPSFVKYYHIRLTTLKKYGWEGEDGIDPQSPLSFPPTYKWKDGRWLSDTVNDTFVFFKCYLLLLDPWHVCLHSCPEFIGAFLLFSCLISRFYVYVDMQRSEDCNLDSSFNYDQAGRAT